MLAIIIASLIVFAVVFMLRMLSWLRLVLRYDVKCSVTVFVFFLDISVTAPAVAV